MIRSSTSEFKKYGPEDYNEGSILNIDLKQDIKIRQESENFYGLDKWFAGHRNGETGLNNSDTQDITNYKNGVIWIKKQIESDKKYLTDDTRFWIYVKPI
jgi:glycosyl hydrolase family 134